MTNTKRGTFGGLCFTPDCTETGVMGIPHCDPSLIAGNPNGRHRCKKCRDAIWKLTSHSWDDAARVLSLPVGKLRRG